MKNKLRIIFKCPSIIVSLVLILLVTTMSIGYAFYSSELSTIGLINIDIDSNVDCIATSLTNENNKNTTYISSSYTNQEHNGKSIITSNVYGTFNSGSGDYMTMIIKIKNVSSVEQTFVDFSNSSSLNSNANFLPQPRMLNLVIGDVLKPNESRDVKVIYYYKDKISDQNSFEANFRFVFEDGKVNVNVPNLVGVIDDSDFLVENEYFNSNVSIANNFDVSVKYYLRVDNKDGSVGLVDASHKESSYSSILDAGANEKRPIYFKVDLGTKTSVTTKLYIETENGEIFDIKELTFKKSGSTQVEPNIPVNIIVDGVSKWQGSIYNLWFEVDNSANDKPLSDYSIVIKFKDGCALTRINYWGTGVAEWNSANYTYTIYGINQWIADTRPHYSIPANTKEKFGIFQVYFSDELESINDYIESVIIKNEIHDPGKSDTTCSINAENEFVCSSGN